MDHMLQTHNQIIVRQIVHRAARCPWCLGPLTRAVNTIDGETEKIITCRNEQCGWELRVAPSRTGRHSLRRQEAASHR